MMNILIALLLSGTICLHGENTERELSNSAGVMVQNMVDLANSEDIFTWQY